MNREFLEQDFTSEQIRQIKNYTILLNDIVYLKVPLK